MAIRKRGSSWTVKVYDPSAPGRQRWVGTFKTENEAIDGARAATVGIAPSARARTIQDWSMLWLRDYARPALSTQRTYRYAVERVNADVGELLLANTDGGPLVQRLYGHPSERGMRDQIRLAFGSWGAEEEQAQREVPGNGQVS